MLRLVHDSCSFIIPPVLVINRVVLVSTTGRMELEFREWKWSLENGIGVYRMELEFRECNWSLENGIGVYRMELEFIEWNWSLENGIGV